MNNQQAIDRLLKHLEWGWSEETVEAIKMGIHALEKIKWIPCNERMPKGTVICCDDRGEMLVGLLCKDEAGYVAYDDDGQKMYNCVAWMPLPEPYRGNK